jgi:hypothetical protein
MPEIYGGDTVGLNRSISFARAISRALSNPSRMSLRAIKIVSNQMIEMRLKVCHEVDFATYLAPLNMPILSFELVT